MGVIQERANWRPLFTIAKFNPQGELSSEEVAARHHAGLAGYEPYAVEEFEGNLLLNAGITEMLNLISGNGSPTAFSNANARIGVGDSTTAAAAGQTGLVAATNKTYKAMEASYPTVSGQTITFRSVFASGDANYAWEEFTVDNGATAGVSMNRRVSAQGTKASGQTWTVDVAITLS